MKLSEAETRKKVIDPILERVGWKVKGGYVKEYDKVIYPEDKDSFAKLIKEKGIYEYFSQVNYSRLSPAIIKRDINIDKEIIDKVKITKSFRVVLIDKSV